MYKLQSPFSGKSPFGASPRGGGGLAMFTQWFLASGTWDNEGRWVDAAYLWDAPWFLENGRINVFGRWDDSKDIW